MSRDYNSFKFQDPYNPQNIVEGRLYLKDKQYGDLHILKINGKKCEQYIFTTPKFKYPNGGDSPSRFEASINQFSLPEYDELYIYDKVDATNIFLFGYYDSEGNYFRSYKTRLSPFLNKDSAIGNWVVKWNKCLQKYDFSSLLDLHSYNFGFEFYSDVEHLVSYDRIYDCDFLYAIDLKGNFHLPQKFDTKIPIPELLMKTNSKDFKFIYLFFIELIRGKIINLPEISNRKEYYEKLKEIEIKMEGVMIYGVKNGEVSFAYKCKPIEIVEIQTKESTNEISLLDIRTTCVNSLEQIISIDNLKEETIKLLRETYTDEEIKKSQKNIEYTIDQIKSDYLFKDKVMKWYDELDISVKSEKKTVMQKISKHNEFKKHQGKIYQILDPFFKK